MVLGSLTGPSSADRMAAAGAVGYRSESEFGSLIFRPQAATAISYRVRKHAPEASEGLASPIIQRGARVDCDYDFSKLPHRWQCLGDSFRSQLLSKTQADPGWREIVVHSSGLAAEDPRYLVALHEAVLGIEGDMAYHFLIGRDLDGENQVRFSARWERPAEESFKDGRIHICLTGDFDRSKPAPSQLRALHELVLFLRARVGEIPVKLHGGAGGCLGRQFPGETVTQGMNAEVSPGLRGAGERVAAR